MKIIIPKPAARTLNHYRYLIEKEIEYGGFINLTTGESQLISGKIGEVNLHQNIHEFRERSNQGERVFHTHQQYRIPEPSGADVIMTSIAGFDTYIITAIGIYVLTPHKTFEVHRPRQISDQIEDEITLDLYDEDIYYEEVAKALKVTEKLYSYDVIERYI